MPAPINSNIKLKECIFGYSEAAKKSDAEFLRLWRMAFRGFKQMGLNAFWEPQTLELKVEDSKVAFIPPEVLQWIKIGMFNWNGELETLRINENLTTYHDDLPDRFIDILPEIQDVGDILTSGLWFSGYGYYNGMGGSTNVPFGLHSRLVQAGECNVDMKHRVISLNTNFPYPYIIMEAIVSPELSNDYEIPMQFEMAMIAFLGWQNVEYLPSSTHVNEAMVNRLALRFKAQLKLAKKSYKPFRLQDAYQTAVESQMMAPKP